MHRPLGRVTYCLLVYIAGFWLYGRLIAGHLLLGCGSSSARPVMLLIAASYLFEAVRKLFATGDEVIQDLSFGAFFLLLAFGRLQIGENGV